MTSVHAVGRCDIYIYIYLFIYIHIFVHYMLQDKKVIRNTRRV